MSARPGGKVSYGLLMYRRRDGALEVFLAHPGGPYFRNKDDGAWTVPKGEGNAGEDGLECAKREFQEETGLTPGPGAFLALGEIRQRGGKLVHAWAFEGDWDGAPVQSNHFEIEWPPRSGQRAQFPEVDRAAFFSLEHARVKLNPAQLAFLDRLAEALSLAEE
jgi:predicted NUDIX family NTP pyrophosphohydrolase